jgi:transposase
MFIQRFKKTVGRKTYTSVFLVENYRDNGKIKRRYILNLSKWLPEQVDAVETALKVSRQGQPLLPRGVAELQIGIRKAIGGIGVVKALCDRLKISAALGPSEEAQQVLLMIAARLLFPKSKYAIARWARRQEVETVFGLESGRLDENALYAALDWLLEHQEKIEQRVFRLRYPGASVPSLFLYDVTSSYLEGMHNALADWGYNRDKKSGKPQIVIGLLTDGDGDPVSVRVFQGNTADPKTVPSQITTLARAFGVRQVTLVGDKGMLRGPQIDDLHKVDFSYITAVSKPEIRSLLAHKTVEYSLFDEHVVDVADDAAGVRYILRRNPIRQREIRANRAARVVRVQEFVQEQNAYLAESARRSADVALRKVRDRIRRYKLSKILEARLAEHNERELLLEQHHDALAEVELLDGCYVIKTDLSADTLDAQHVHDRYKDLASVETAFRTMKSELEIRPLYHRLETRTRAHVFVCMLAYLVEREFERLTTAIEGTLKEKWDLLDHVMSVEVNAGAIVARKVAEPSDEARQILRALKVKLPTKLVEEPVGAKSRA